MSTPKERHDALLLADRIACGGVTMVHIDPSTDECARMRAITIEALRAFSSAHVQRRRTEQSYVDMLWKWFEDRGCDLRPEHVAGLSAEDFRTMLDEREAALTSTVANA